MRRSSAPIVRRSTAQLLQQAVVGEMSSMGGYISRFWMMASFRDKLTLQALEGMKITSFTATDVALQMLLDGCQVTKLQNHETTPLIFINLNLTPQRRYRNGNCLNPGYNNAVVRYILGSGVM